MPGINLSKHFSIVSAPLVEQICQPLTMLDITSFKHVINYTDGSQATLCSNGTWLEHFYQHNYQRLGYFEKHPHYYQTGFVLWQTLNQHKVFHDGRELFNCDNGITLVIRHEDCCEFYHFGSLPKHAHMPNFYLNNLDLLQRFILYFQAKGKELIRKAQKERFMIPNHYSCHEKNDTLSKKIAPEVLDQFIEKTQLKRFKLQGNLSGIELSEKECQILLHILEGHGVKEIAAVTGRSLRTIETHLGRIKKKLNCKTTVEMISKLIQSGFSLHAPKKIQLII